MDLKNLKKWTTGLKKIEDIRRIVKKDKNGNPVESEIIVVGNLLKEINVRADLVSEHQKKSERYLGDIVDYLQTLEKRGIKYNYEEEGASKQPARP